MSQLYIDAGGTHLRCERHGAGGVVRERFDSAQTGLMEAIERQIAREPGIDFIGIAYAGQVEGGRILSAPNIDIDEPEIRDAVKRKYGIRLEIDNDLKCAARAEARYWNVRDVAVLALGTGIGAGVIDQGRLVRGEANLAGEIGHIPYREAPFRCGCGRTNCLELYASGSGMRKWMEHYGRTGECDLARFRISDDISERSIAAEFEGALMHGVGTLVTLFNPALLVLSGGIAAANPYLVGMIGERLADVALGGSLERLRIELSALENGPLEGAKLLEEREWID